MLKKNIDKLERKAARYPVMPSPKLEATKKERIIKAIKKHKEKSNDN